MATTIKAYAHNNLESFVKAVAASAAKGDFFDASSWPRSFYGNRPYSPFPNTDLVSGGSAPKDSGQIAKTGNTLYTADACPVQRFGQFINDIQAAVASGGVFAGKTVDRLLLTDHSTKPYFRCNVLFAAGGSTPALTVTVTPAAAQNKTVGQALGTLTANPTGGTAPYTYVWKKDGTALTPAATGKTLSKSSLALTDAGDYTVEVTDAAGAKKESTAVTVNVTAAAAKTVTGKGNITGKKQGDVLAEGDLFTYAGGASIADVASVSVTPATGAATWDDTAKTLTIDDAAVVGNDITVAFTTAAGVTKAGTIVIKSVAAK